MTLDSLAYTCVHVLVSIDLDFFCICPKVVLAKIIFNHFQWALSWWSSFSGPTKMKTFASSLRLFLQKCIGVCVVGSKRKFTLAQIMAWCRQATSHYLNQCWPRSLPYLHYQGTMSWFGTPDWRPLSNMGHNRRYFRTISLELTGSAVVRTVSNPPDTIVLKIDSWKYI